MGGAHIRQQDFKSLQLFVAVCELGSLTRASEHLRMAASAASRRIQLLEHEAKTPLLERLPHGVKPTSAGLTFLRFARDILHLVERADHLLAQHETGMRGYVRVASSSSVLLGCLAGHLSAFATDHPDIKIDLEERGSEATLEMVRSKQADIGLVVAGADTYPLESVPYADGDRLILAVPRSHSFASKDVLKFRDFADQSFVTLGQGTAVRRVLAEQAHGIGTALNIRVQASSFEAMALLVAKGLGIAVMPEPALWPLKDAYEIKAIEIGEQWARRQFVLCVRNAQHLDPPAGRLRAFLQQV